MTDFETCNIIQLIKFLSFFRYILILVDSNVIFLLGILLQS